MAGGESIRRCGGGGGGVGSEPPGAPAASVPGVHPRGQQRTGLPLCSAAQTPALPSSVQEGYLYLLHIPQLLASSPRLCSCPQTPPHLDSSLSLPSPSPLPAAALSAGAPGLLSLRGLASELFIIQWRPGLPVQKKTAHPGTHGCTHTHQTPKPPASENQAQVNPLFLSLSVSLCLSSLPPLRLGSQVSAPLPLPSPPLSPPHSMLVLGT